jgi:hypothetical protein
MTNTVEFAVRWNSYAIDFGNPAPDAELTSVGARKFEWVVEESAKWLLLRQKKKPENESDLGNIYERRGCGQVNF